VSATIWAAVIGASATLIGLVVVEVRLVTERKRESEITAARLDQVARADAAEADARARRENTKAVDRRTREVALTVRQRRDAEYAELASVLTSWGAWIDHAVDGRPSEVPTLDLQRELRGRIGLVGSDTVTSLLDGLLSGLGDIQRQVVMVEKLLQDESLSPESQERRWGTTFTREMRKLDVHARQARRTLAGIRSTLRAELHELA
jgi:hypothetical protein